MNKVTLASILTVISLGGAAAHNLEFSNNSSGGAAGNSAVQSSDTSYAIAYNAADDFGVGEQNDLPLRLRRHVSGPDAENITSGTGTGTSGYPVPAQIFEPQRVYRGYNAADDFDFSDENDLPLRLRR